MLWRGDAETVVSIAIVGPHSGSATHWVTETLFLISEVG